MNYRTRKYRRRQIIFNVIITVLSVIFVAAMVGFMLSLQYENNLGLYTNTEPISYTMYTQAAIETQPTIPDGVVPIQAVPVDTPAVETIPVETASVPTDVLEEVQSYPAADTSESKTMLDNMAQLYARNNDIVGWVRIEGTQIDSPVMYTPYEPEKYLRKSFDEQVYYPGVPFIDASCSVDPRSDNLLIYGHNMRDGSIFNNLLRYETRTFWQQHPRIFYATLYEESEYEILSVFYDRVYYERETCFKFYKFIDAENEADFNETISILKTKSLYDTGVTASYGDDLLMLVTCAYHVDNGRFVVVARKIA